MTESELQKQIMDMLFYHPDVAWRYVTSTGTFKGIKGGSPIRIGVPGMPDIVGMLRKHRGGKLFGIEVKLPGNQPTDKQVEFITMINEEGGLAGWADSVDKAREIIDG